jgi:isopentenyldiphosphate isomerase
MVELLDVVDDDDCVIGYAERKDAYLQKLPHRIVHVLLFNSNQEIALQLRGMNVSFCPGHWSTTVGGHVLSGESYEDAAIRESREEIGILADPKFFAKDEFVINGIKKFVTTFTMNYEGPFVYEDGEAQNVQFFSPEKIRQMIADGEKLHPELLFLLQKHF